MILKRGVNIKQAQLGHSRRSLFSPEDELMNDPADHKRRRYANLPPKACAVHKRVSVLHKALLHDRIIDLHAKQHSITGLLSLSPCNRCKAAETAKCGGLRSLSKDSAGRHLPRLLPGLELLQARQLESAREHTAWQLQLSLQACMRASKRRHQEAQCIAGGQIPAPRPEVGQAAGEVGLVEVRRDLEPDEARGQARRPIHEHAQERIHARDCALAERVHQSVTALQVSMTLGSSNFLSTHDKSSTYKSRHLRNLEQ